MGNLSGFNANEVPPNEGFTPLPAGDYQVMIIASKMKPTKNGEGKYLELQLQVVNGKYQNRKLFDRLNLVNKNEQAVQIANGTLSSICRAVNVLTPNDSSELHNKVMTAKIKVRNDNNGNPQNYVSGYLPRQTQSSNTTNMIEQAFVDDAAESNINVSPF